MKMPVLRRIAVFILCVLLIGISLFAVLFSLNLFREERVFAWITGFRADLRCRIILLIISIIVAVLCVYLLRPVRKAADPLKDTVLISRGDSGGTFITLSALETMVNRFLSSQSRIREHNASVVNGSGGVNIELRLVVVADTDIAALTDNLHRALEEYVSTVAGIRVKDIRILIEEADLSGSDRIEDVTAAAVTDVHPEDEATEIDQSDASDAASDGMEHNDPVPLNVSSPAGPENDD